MKIKSIGREKNHSINPVRNDNGTDIESMSIRCRFDAFDVERRCRFHYHFWLRIYKITRKKLILNFSDGAARRINGGSRNNKLR